MSTPTPYKKATVGKDELIVDGRVYNVHAFKKVPPSSPLLT
jgi:hypothetical protein